MNTITLNGTEVEYNNIYYISSKAERGKGDGTKENPFSEYDEVYHLTKDGDLIYFIKGNYVIKKLPSAEYMKKYLDSSCTNSFLFDGYRKLTIYAEPYTYVKIDNPENEIRDTHAINLGNKDSKVIGFIIDYNVTNKHGNYSKCVIGGNENQRGFIYNCHFIIRSTTAFSYANSSNTLKCINCQFEILKEPEHAYSGKTYFDKCIFNVRKINEDCGFKAGKNMYRQGFEDNYRCSSYSCCKEYGIFSGDYKWVANIKLLKKPNEKDIAWSKDLTDDLPSSNITSSEYHSGRYEYVPYWAFDNHENDDVYSGFQMDVADKEEKDWLKIDFINEVAPSKMTLQANVNYALPKKILISMSNDDIHYTDIATIDDIINNDTEYHEYTFKRPSEKYRYLKITFLEQYNNSLMEINQIEFFEEMINIKYLLKQDDDYYSIKKNYLGDVCFTKISCNANTIDVDVIKKEGFNSISMLNTLCESKEVYGKRLSIDEGVLYEFNLDESIKYVEYTESGE